MKTCRRNHPLTRSNVRVQKGYYTPKGSKRRKVLTTKVCKACAKYRQQRRAAGKPVKDMRKGAR